MDHILQTIVEKQDRRLGCATQVRCMLPKYLRHHEAYARQQLTFLYRVLSNGQMMRLRSCRKFRKSVLTKNTQANNRNQIGQLFQFSMVYSPCKILTLQIFQGENKFENPAKIYINLFDIKLYLVPLKRILIND